MCMYSLMNWLLYLVNLTSVFSRNKDLFSFISRPSYKQEIVRYAPISTARNNGEGKKGLKKWLLIKKFKSGLNK